MNISIDGSGEMVNLLVWLAVLGLVGYLVFAVFKSVMTVVIVLLVVGLLVPGAISFSNVGSNPLGTLSSGPVSAAGTGTGTGPAAGGGQGAGAGGGAGAEGTAPRKDLAATILDTIMKSMTVLTDWLVAWGLEAFNRYMTPEMQWQDGGGGGGGTGTGAATGTGAGTGTGGGSSSGGGGNGGGGNGGGGGTAGDGKTGGGTADATPVPKPDGLKELRDALNN